jgi:hypothetical protein
VAPPERPARSQKASVLPPPPTVSSSRARIDREPEITARAIASDDENSSNTSSESESDSSAKRSDHSTDSDSRSAHDSDGGVHAKVDTSSVRFGPPKSKQKPSKSEDVTMHSPPHASASQRGRARDVKAVGSSSRHAKSAQSSGASRAYGGIIRGKALGNAPNIGDFDLVEPDHQFVNVEGTVNILPSNTRPTTIDIDETAVIAAIIPFEEDLASLLHSVSKYYSSMLGMYSKVYLKIVILIFYF